MVRQRRGTREGGCKLNRRFSRRYFRFWFQLEAIAFDRRGLGLQKLLVDSSVIVKSDVARRLSARSNRNRCARGLRTRKRSPN
jgi:hypothetical protein